MENNFIESWANMFMGTAQSRKTMECFNTWFRQGVTGMGELNALFQKTCGLDMLSKQGSPEYFFKWTQEGFEKFFKDFQSLLGTVPREEYIELVRKYEEVKENIASRDETIEHLQMMLAEKKKIELDDMSRKIDALVQQQADHFQKLMDSLSKSAQPVEETTTHPVSRKKKE